MFVTYAVCLCLCLVCFVCVLWVLLFSLVCEFVIICLRLVWACMLSFDG